jgi:tetratricopeptide (TPR) repeat protein
MPEAILIIFAAVLIYYVVTKVATPGLMFKLSKDVEEPKKNKEGLKAESNDSEKPEQELLDEGQKLFNISDFEKAEKKFLAAIKIDPKAATAYHFLGMIYLRQKMYKGAIAALEKGCKIDPLNDTAFNNLGLAYYNTQNFEKAIENFEKSISLNDKIAHRYTNIALAHQEMKNLDKAAIYFEQAVKIHANSENLTLLAKNYLSMSNKKLALGAIERLLEIDPHNAWAKRQSATLKD